MSVEETNIDDLFDNMELETDETAAEEAALLDIFAKDPSISSVTDDDDASDKGEDGKKTTPDTSTIIPDSEEDFVKKLSPNQTKTEDDDDTDTDDRDDSYDRKNKLESGDDDDTSTYFKAVAEGLSKLGKFEGLEIPEKMDQDSFLEFYEKFTENKVQSDIEERISDKWGEDGIRMFNDIFVSGVDPREYFAAYQQVLDVSDIDLDDENNQKLVVSRYLEAIGQDDEEILDQIETLEEKGKLAERAEKYKEKLIEDNKREIARMAYEKESQAVEMKKAQSARFSAVKEAVSTALSNREINGIPLSLNDNKELLPFATDLNWKLANGMLITDADKAILEIKKDPVKWVALCKLLKEDLNVNPIKNKGADEKAKAVFDFKSTGKVDAKNGKRDPLDLFLKKTKF